MDVYINVYINIYIYIHTNREGDRLIDRERGMRVTWKFREKERINEQGLRRRK